MLLLTSLLATACRNRGGGVGAASRADVSLAAPTAPVPVLTERDLIRELTYQTDPVTHTWRTFEARRGARIPAEGIWQRYAPFLGIPPTALVPIRPPRKHPIIPNAVLIDYGQMHLGYPVGGYGYSITVKDGLFVDGLGKTMTDLPATLPAPISRERAAEVAFARVEPKGPPFPWVTEPGRWQAPQATLTLWSPKQPPRGADFLLVWHFSFSSTGIREPGSITIDAVTSAVLATSSGRVR